MSKYTLETFKDGSVRIAGKGHWMVFGGDVPVNEMLYKFNKTAYRLQGVPVEKKSSSNTITVNLLGDTDKVEVGRKIVEAIKAYERAGGKR